MSWELLKGNWNQLKGEVKSEWGKLTDDDLIQIDGEVDKLIGKIQERYQMTRDEAQRQIDKLGSRIG